MLKIVSILLVLFTSIFSVYAAQEVEPNKSNGTESQSEVSIEEEETEVIQKTEEEVCYDILMDSISKDSRFNGKNKLDFTNLMIDESTGENVNASTYQAFIENRAQNPKNFSPFFHARRTNIGTIVANNNFVVSQVMGFGPDSNFDFPLKAKGEKSFGHKYILGGKEGDFKGGIVYTHHIGNIIGKGWRDSGKLLSCGIVRVTPLADRGYGDISEQNYFTNILKTKGCTSSFEGKEVNIEDKDFYNMKVTVCANDYVGEPFVKMDVISVAYDNKAKFFNEYITHPLQVKAMKDAKNKSGGLVAVRQAFLDLVYDTNLGIVNKIGGISDNGNKFFNKIIDFFIPQAAAKLNVSEMEPVESPEMVTYENLPYRLFKKLESIPNEEFKSYIKLAITPQIENIINNRKKNGILLTPFEETFLKCKMDYETRNNIVVDFLEKLDVENFDVNSLEYLDEKFGDCIIPYPDKDHKDKLIEDSFTSNKLLVTGVDEKLKNSQVDEYIKKIAAIEKEHNTKLTELEKKFNNLEIDIEDYEKEKQKLIEDYNEKINTTKIESFENTGNIITEDDELIVQPKNNESKYLFIAIGLVLLGLLILYVTFKFKNKSKTHE